MFGKQNSNFLLKISELNQFSKKIDYSHNYLLSPEEILAEDYKKLIQLKRKPKDFEKLNKIEKEFFNNLENLLN